MHNLRDPNFAMTVTCICEHTALGSVGIIVNRPHAGISGKDIFAELNLTCPSNSQHIPVYIGGPVHANEIFVLHGPPFGWEGCFMVTPFLAMSNTIDIIESISLERGPSSFLMCLGCAGWGPGQLEYEIKQNSWITTEVCHEIIFTLPVESKWKAAMNRAGIDPTILSTQAGHA